MGFLTDLLHPQVGAYTPPGIDDEGAWTTVGSVGSISQAGLYVGPERALQTSAVWSCARLIAESIATMPIIMYRRLSDGGKERAPTHPLYSVLHDAPNSLMTAFAFKRTMMVHALLYGNGYAEIGDGPRGVIDHLTLLHPDTVRVEAIPGGIRYQVREGVGRERPVNAEDMLHLPGLSLDGVSGLSLVAYARESIGLALAAEGYSARFYSQNARPGGILQTPNKLNDDVAKRVKDSWEAAHAGLANAHRVAVLEQGLEWKQTGMTNQDADLIAQLDWSIADVARFFNVPLHMIQQMTKTTSWGSGIEEMSIEFVTYSLLPWVRNWEDTIRKDLIVARRTYFAEFLLEGLLRGKQSDRYEAYTKGRQWGWLSINDIRRIESMNPVPNGDTYLQPLNMVPIGTPPAQGPQATHYQLMVREAAARVVRKEIAAMTKVVKRHALDSEAYTEAASAFYAEHSAFVAAVMHIAAEAADAYCAGQCAALISKGIDVVAEWEARAVDTLIALATGEQA